MVMLALRFDLRNPSFAGVSGTDRVQAAVDMAAWADERGGVSVSLSEHHGSEDGYLPSPLIVAAAMAARTRHVRISLAALIAPFYEPLRLAEDLAVLDDLSSGRIDVILANGYRAEEFEMLGVPISERAKRTEEAIETLRKAWTGKPFEYRGRTVQVTPAPARTGGPAIVLGGSSNAAARRAARLADGFVPSNAECWTAYRDEMQKLGKGDPGPGMMTGQLVSTVLAEDVDLGWDTFAPYFLHDMNTYGDWLETSGTKGPYWTTTLDQLRDTGAYRVVTPATLVDELRAMGDFAVTVLHPMVGGIPPKLAWESLRLFDQEVLPALR
jgi:alkanesulfonate monooxygenase SsuD/methylene tetrahydromethanopterin reductase-like flavin-dependent oxidoreductase (luciferase family)